MAEAVLTGRQRPNVSGHQRVTTYTGIHFAAPGDTWHVRGVKTIFQIGLMPTEPLAFGFEVNGNILTLEVKEDEGRSGGEGFTFRGSVYGL